jgi:hypothetical protein
MANNNENLTKNIDDLFLKIFSIKSSIFSILLKIKFKNTKFNFI